MGYCEGGDLHSRLKTHGDSFLPETKVVEWFVQIALGLQYLHDRNILHRDLKVSLLPPLGTYTTYTAFIDTKYISE